MKVEIGTKFKIGYRAKKHNDEFIWREGMWTEGCGLWTAKNGKTILTYWDIIQNGFRNATEDFVFMTTPTKNNKEIN